MTRMQDLCYEIREAYCWDNTVQNCGQKIQSCTVDRIQEICVEEIAVRGYALEGLSGIALDILMHGWSGASISFSNIMHEMDKYDELYDSDNWS